MYDLAAARAYMSKHGIVGAINTQLMVAGALTRGVEVAPATRNRIRLRHGRKTLLYRGGGSTLNDRLAAKCTRDKVITSRLLRSRGVPAPENLCFHPSELRRAWDWARAITPVVIKPSRGRKGCGVHIGISDKLSFERAFASVAEQFGEVVVEAFSTGTEHRIVVIDGKVVAATRRIPAHVMGDGRSTVAELVAAKNSERLEKGLPKQWNLDLSQAAITQLRPQNLRVNSVPVAGKYVTLRATSNISTGADPVDATDDLSGDEVSMVEQAARAIPGLRIAGFDVLLPRQPHERGACILEVNSKPGFAMHHFPLIGVPRDVTYLILDCMFPAITTTRAGKV